MGALDTCGRNCGAFLVFVGGPAGRGNEPMQDSWRGCGLVGRAPRRPVSVCVRRLAGRCLAVV